MKRIILFNLCLTILCCLCVGAAAQKKTPAASSGSNVASTGASQRIREGERVFETNCGRCHNPPEDLSPREARAVVRQMRVRAILSDRDERALLKFLAP